jgi:NADPH:quinone reductase-like Zn-dependent oxidoreductase
MEINQSTSEPKVTAGKVLVIVKSAGTNPIDWKIREGYMQQMIPLQFPSILGMDFSGIVKQVKAEGEEGERGKDTVSLDFKEGDQVYGQAGVITGGSGAFAELALANAQTIAYKPKSLDHVHTAALPLVGVSAWQVDCSLIRSIHISPW